MTTKKTLVPARVLVDVKIDGVPYKPNQVISAEASVIEKHEAALDSTAGAVKYCIKELGAEVITHEPAAEDSSDEAASAENAGDTDASQSVSQPDSAP